MPINMTLTIDALEAGETALTYVAGVAETRIPLDVERYQLHVTTQKSGSSLLTSTALVRMKDDVLFECALTDIKTARRVTMRASQKNIVAQHQDVLATQGIKIVRDAQRVAAARIEKEKAST